MQFTYDQIHCLCLDIAQVLTAYADISNKFILPVQRGGVFPAMLISRFTNIPLLTGHLKRDENMHYTLQSPLGISVDDIIVVDDIYDTGNTFKQLRDLHLVNFVFLMHRKVNALPKYSTGIIHSQLELDTDAWITFPWEIDDKKD